MAVHLKEEAVAQDVTGVARKFYEALNRGEIDAIAALMADDFIDHEELPGMPPTKAGVLEFFRQFLVAFPDLRMEPQEVLVAGEKAVARVRMMGTHKGPFMGIPPTGKRIDVNGIDIIQFGSDGKAAEHWGVTDNMAMMQQLGVIPEMGT